MPDEPCPNCGEPGCDSECLLIGTGAPGADRRAYLREHASDLAGADDALAERALNARSTGGLVIRLDEPPGAPHWLSGLRKQARERAKAQETARRRV